MKIEVKCRAGKDLNSRRRAGRQWPADRATIVRVVDAPRPPIVTKDGSGLDVVIPNDEISPAQLAELRADSHFSVRELG